LAQRSGFQGVLMDVRRDLVLQWTDSLGPGPVVASQCFPHCESDEARAIALVGIPSIADLIKLQFSNPGEPAPETFAVIERVQFSLVGKPIPIHVFAAICAGWALRR